MDKRWSILTYLPALPADADAAWHIRQNSSQKAELPFILPTVFGDPDFTKSLIALCALPCRGASLTSRRVSKLGLCDSGLLVVVVSCSDNVLNIAAECLWEGGKVHSPLRDVNQTQCRRFSAKSGQAV